MTFGQSGLYHRRFQLEPRCLKSEFASRCSAESSWIDCGRMRIIPLRTRPVGKEFRRAAALREHWIARHLFFNDHSCLLKGVNLERLYFGYYAPVRVAPAITKDHNIAKTRLYNLPCAIEHESKIFFFRAVHVPIIRIGSRV